VQDDVDAEVADAMVSAMVSLRLPDALRRRIEQLKGEAEQLRNRKAFMRHRLRETQQGDEPVLEILDSVAAAAAAAVDEAGPSGSSQAVQGHVPGEAAGTSTAAAAAAAAAANGDADGDPGSPSSPAAAAAIGPADLPVQRPGVECPVCLTEIRGEMRLLPCGHNFCETCTNNLVPSGVPKISCPVCRAVSNFKQASFH